MCISMSTETSFSSIHQSTSPHATTVKSSLNSLMTSSDGTTMETPKSSTRSASPDATTVESSSNSFMTPSDGTIETLITSGNSLLQSFNSSVIL